MAKITVEEQKEFTLLPVDSILHLKVDEIEIKDVQGQHGPWQKIEFKFKVLGIQAVGDASPAENYEDVIASPIWGSVPFRLTDSPENKLRQWAEAIFGMELGVGYELDTDHFLRREVRGITAQYPKKAKNPATGQPFMGHQIDALLPWGQGNAPAAPPQDPWATQQAPNGYAQPQQQAPQNGYQNPGYAQQAYQEQVAAQGGGWATPGVQQQQAPPPQQQQQPQYQPPQQDPWATSGDGPGF